MANHDLKKILKKLETLLGLAHYTSDLNKEGEVFEIIWDRIGICHLRLWVKHDFHCFGWSYGDTVYYNSNSKKGQNIRFYPSDLSIVTIHNIFNFVAWLAVANKIAGRVGIRIACGGPEG